jgi:DNA mismatch endonuclease (patch repair protein)
MIPADTRHRVHRSSSEQDRAAGGRDARLVPTERGAVARASVELKRYTDGGACWAYVRWYTGGKTFNRYVGRVHGTSRAEFLRKAWNLARMRGLLGRTARPTARTRRNVRQRAQRRGE